MSDLSLQEQEEILVKLRPSIFPYLPKFVLGLFFLCLPFFFFFSLLSLGWIGILIFCLLFLCGVFLLHGNFQKWNKRYYVITDQAVYVSQWKKGKQVVKKVVLSDIQRAGFHMSGFFPFIFRYGTVRLRLKNQDPVFLLFVYRPATIRRFINELCNS